MPGKWIGCIHKGQGGKRWSPREKKTDRYDHEDKSCNAGRHEYNMQLHDGFSPEPTKEDWPSSRQRIRLPSESTWAR